MFARYYAASLNGKQAALRAGYSYKSVRVVSELLDNPDVKKAIAMHQRELTLEIGDVASRLSQQARAEYSDYIDADGTVDITGLQAAGLGHLIKSVEQTRDGGVKVTFYDAQQSLMAMAKAYGLLDSSMRVEISGPNGAPLSGPNWDLTRLEPEELAELERLLLKATPPQLPSYSEEAVAARAADAALLYIDGAAEVVEDVIEDVEEDGDGLWGEPVEDE